MKTPSGLVVDIGLVERLLARRQRVLPREEMCPEMEAIALVFDGHADAKQIRKAAEHLAQCDSCAVVVDRLHEVTAGAKREKSAKGRFRPSGLRLAWAATGLFGLAVAVFFGIWFSEPGLEEPGSKFLIKGGDTIHIAVQRKARRFKALPGDRLQEGDRLGFFYSAQSAGYLALFDLQGSGSLTTLFPAEGQHSRWIKAGREQPLPDGAVFRKGPACEWLVAVFSDRPLELSKLRAKLRKSVEARPSDCRFAGTVPEARNLWVFPLR